MKSTNNLLISEVFWVLGNKLAGNGRSIKNRFLYFYLLSFSCPSFQSVFLSHFLPVETTALDIVKDFAKNSFPLLSTLKESAVISTGKEIIKRNSHVF